MDDFSYKLLLIIYIKNIVWTEKHKIIIVKYFNINVETKNRGLGTKLVTSDMKLGSYNSFSPSPRSVVFMWKDT